MLAKPFQQPATPLSGQARVVDGDTLEIGRTKIRLFGIDAPERSQTCEARGRDYPCGRRAQDALTALIAGAEVACTKQDEDRYGRIVGVCFAGGRDLNGALVEAGWALAYREYSRSYEDEEATARQAKRGLWQGRFETPAEYRKRLR